MEVEEVEVKVEEGIEVDALTQEESCGVLQEDEASFKKMIVQGQVEEKRNQEVKLSQQYV